MMAVGVASPMAQGQAISSTLTAVTKAKVREGEGPNQSHTRKVRTATPMTTGTNTEAIWSATRWIGGFNPFATYDVAVNKFNGSGQIGLMFRDADAENRITATLVVEDRTYRSIRCIITKDGKETERQDFALPKALSGNDPIRLRVQMMAVGVNLFVEQTQKSTLVGRMDFVRHFDLRRKDLMRRFDSHVWFNSHSISKMVRCAAYIAACRADSSFL